jgi:hypothetical protein
MSIKFELSKTAKERLRLDLRDMAEAMAGNGEGKDAIIVAETVDLAMHAAEQAMRTMLEISDRASNTPTKMAVTLMADKTILLLSLKICRAIAEELEARVSGNGNGEDGDESGVDYSELKEYAQEFNRKMADTIGDDPIVQRAWRELNSHLN